MLKEFKEFKEFKEIDVIFNAAGEASLPAFIEQPPADSGEASQEPFIGEEERPDVGGDAPPTQYPPPSKRTE